MYALTLFGCMCVQTCRLFYISSFTYSAYPWHGLPLACPPPPTPILFSVSIWMNLPLRVTMKSNNHSHHQKLNWSIQFGCFKLALGQDFIADCNIIQCSLLWQCVRRCVLCVQVATRPIYMILVPRHVVNDVTATSLCQSYNEKVYPEHSHRQLYFSPVQQKLNFKEHV